MNAPAPHCQPGTDEAIEALAAEIIASIKAEMSVRDRLANNGRNPANNNAGIRVGSDLHLMEILVREIDDLRSAFKENTAEIATLQARVAELTKALEQIRTAHAGYCITDENQYPGVVESFWKEIQRIERIARSALSLEMRACPRCAGSGHWVEKHQVCHRCNGTGKVPANLEQRGSGK